MRNYIARLEFDVGVGTDEQRHGEVCCLVQAESPEETEQPVRDLVTRLRTQGDAFGGVRELHLADLIELPDGPGDAVLWYASWKQIPQGTASVHASLPIDDSGRAEAYQTHDLDAPGPVEPFMVLEPRG